MFKLTARSGIVRVLSAAVRSGLVIIMIGLSLAGCAAPSRIAGTNYNAYSRVDELTRIDLEIRQDIARASREDLYVMSRQIDRVLELARARQEQRLSESNQWNSATASHFSSGDPGAAFFTTMLSATTEADYRKITRLIEILENARTRIEYRLQYPE